MPNDSEPTVTEWSIGLLVCEDDGNPVPSCGACPTCFAAQRFRKMEADAVVSEQIAATFWRALKRLNLGAIRVQDPGSHFDDLIDENATLRAQLADLQPPPGHEGTSHWPGCHKVRGHHECALALLAEAEKSAAQVAARHMVREQEKGNARAAEICRQIRDQILGIDAARTASDGEEQS